MSRNSPIAATPAAPVAAMRPTFSRVIPPISEQHPAPGRPRRRAEAPPVPPADAPEFSRRRKHRPKDEVVEPFPPSAATASSTSWTDWPMRKPAFASVRARDASNDVPRRWTPCAPAAIATSRRSLTMMRVADPLTSATACRTTSYSSPAGRSSRELDRVDARIGRATATARGRQDAPIGDGAEKRRPRMGGTDARGVV